jgi:hypothetical protein
MLQRASNPLDIPQTPYLPCRAAHAISMSAAPEGNGQGAALDTPQAPRRDTSDQDVFEDDETDEEDDDEDDTEPNLKYEKLTGNVASAYRNGDATSSFAVAADKMVCAPHLQQRITC